MPLASPGLSIDSAGRCGLKQSEILRNIPKSYTYRAPHPRRSSRILQDVETVQQLVKRPDYQRPYALRHHNGRSLPRNDPRGRLIEECPQQHGYAWSARDVFVRSLIGIASSQLTPNFIASPSNLSIPSLKNPMNTVPRQSIPSTLLTYLQSPWRRLPRSRKNLQIRHQTPTEGRPPCTAPSRRCTHPERLKISTPMTTLKSHQSRQRHPCHKYRNNTLNQEANYPYRAD